MNANITIPAGTLIGHLSASSISQYLRCGKQFQLHRIRKAKPTHQSVALPFGSAWGNTLAKWLETSTPTSPLGAPEYYSAFDELFDHELDHAFAPVVFGKGETPEELKCIAHGMLDAFLETIPPPERVLGIEKAFCVVLAHPHDETEELAVPLVGAFDALVEVQGETVVWEFKSAKRRYTDSQFHLEMLQPSAYSYAGRVFDLDSVPVDVLVTTKSKKKPEVQVQRVTRTVQHEVQFYELAEHVLRGVEAGVFPRNRSWACDSCPFREECDR